MDFMGILMTAIRKSPDFNKMHMAHGNQSQTFDSMDRKSINDGGMFFLSAIIMTVMGTI